MRYFNRFGLDHLFSEYEQRHCCFDLPGLGGGGTDNPSASTTTTQSFTLTPEQRRLFGLALPFAEQFGETPIQNFPGSRVAPTDPLVTQSQESGLATAAGPVTDILNRAVADQQFFTRDALLPESNPALRASIEAAIRPLEENLTTNILPNIRGEALKAGGFGSNRQGIAEGLAIKGFNQTAGDVAANIISANFQNALEQAVRAHSLTPQLAGLQFLPSAVQEGVGISRQTDAQARLNEQVSNFFFEQLAPLFQAEALIGLGAGLPGGTTTSHTITAGGGEPKSNKSNFQAVAGGAMTGAAMGSVAGPYGAIIGAVIGGAAALIDNESN